MKEIKIVALIFLIFFPSFLGACVTDFNVRLLNAQYNYAMNISICSNSICIVEAQIEYFEDTQEAYDELDHCCCLELPGCCLY